MTKNEFKLQALIAMCSNPKYATKDLLYYKEMVEDVEDLANEAVKIAHFETEYNEPIETTKKLLYDTCSAIEEISMPDGKLDFMNDTLKGIEKSLDWMNELLGKLVSAAVDEEEPDAEAEE